MGKLTQDEINVDLFDEAKRLQKENTELKKLKESNFNDLTAAEMERLVLLAEEMGEAIQAIGKILRHGYESTHPDGGLSNREALEQECGDVQYAIQMLCASGDLNTQEICDRINIKAESVKEYLHHQPDVCI